VIEKLRHNDMRALDEANLPPDPSPEERGKLGNPRSGGIHQGIRMDRLTPLAVLDGDVPAAGAARSRDRLGPRTNGRSMLGGIAGIEHHEPRVVDPAIGILKAGSEHSGLQRPPSRIPR
jgi:hypothetical protein